MKNLIYLLFFISVFVTAQVNNCDSLSNQTSKDCNNAYCEDCIPLLLKYDLEDCYFIGLYELEYIIPNYWVNIIQANKATLHFGGDLAGTFFYNELETSPIILEFPTGSSNSLNITVLDSNDILLGKSFHFFEPFLPQDCHTSSFDSLLSCETDLIVDYIQLPIESKNHYILQLIFQNGNPPYKIYDLDAEGFYDFTFYDDTFYIGSIPDTIGLNLRISDMDSCLIDLCIFAPEDSNPDSCLTDVPIPPVEELAVEPIDLNQLNIQAWSNNHNIFIKNPNNLQYNFQLYNLQGEVYATQSKLSDNLFLIDIHQFPKGVLLLYVSDNNQQKVFRLVNF